MSSEIRIFPRRGPLVVSPDRGDASNFDASGQEEPPQHGPTADTTNIEAFANVAAVVESTRPSNIPDSSFSHDSTAIQQSMSSWEACWEASMSAGGRCDWEAYIRLIQTHRPTRRFRRRLDDVDVSPSFRPASGFDDNDFDGGSTTYDCESSSPPSDSEESEEDSCPPPNRASASNFDASGQEEPPQHGPTADTTNIEAFANVAAAVESIRPSNIPDSSFSRDSTAIQQSMSNVPIGMVIWSQNNDVSTTEGEGPEVRSWAERVGEEATIYGT
jgi:hypothetical protein